jgi:hypothetical protein
MSIRDLIDRELEVLPEGLQREVLDFVSFLSSRARNESFNGLLASEAVLARDWETAEEDEAWQNL